MQKIFSMRTKLTHYKVFHRKCISNINEKKLKYRWTSLFIVHCSLLQCSSKSRWYLQRYCGRHLAFPISEKIVTNKKKIKKVITLMRDKLSEQIMKKIVGFGAEMNTFLKDNHN